MHIRKINAFRPDGKDIVPRGVFSAGYINAMRKNEKSFINKPMESSYLLDKIPTRYGYSNYNGGMIVFLNTAGDINIDNLRELLKKTYNSILSSKYRGWRINRAVQRWKKMIFGKPDSLLIGGFTFGKNFTGDYIDLKYNLKYNDKSQTIEIGGIPYEILMLFALVLCTEYKQPSIIVKDFNTDNIYIVDSDGDFMDAPPPKPEPEKIKSDKNPLLNIKLR